MNSSFKRTALRAAAAIAAMSLSGHVLANAPTACQLGNMGIPGISAGTNIQHVVYIQFDNVHQERDLPNVPSDLEQMPALQNFLTGNGTLFVNSHTPLISHTADDILTSLTGVYGDRHGQPVTNSYGYFTGTGSVSFSSSFGYWTDPEGGSTTVPLMIAQNSLVTPAPWVPFTRKGCDVGQVSTANTVLENTTSDILKVFGNPSPEYTEAQSNPTLAQADFVGIGVHCGFGSTLCANNSNARKDLLRAEPGGYAGYKGLFGHKYVAATLSPTAPLKDINGNTIHDPSNNPGFPGFDGMSAAVSLGYIATMLESNIPVVFAYISDAHDNHVSGSAPCPSGYTCAYGSGEAGYVAQLASYNAAFTTFFQRLAADGITPANTLFIVTTDEQDHVGETKNPTPAGCDGVTTPCTYNHTPFTGNVGEVNLNLKTLLSTTASASTSFSIHSDMSPTWYINGNPAQTASVTRQLERDVAAMQVTNPYTGNTETVVDYLADQAGMSMLHMVTSDSTRTPTFVSFQKGDYYSFASTSSTNKCFAASQSNTVAGSVFVCPNFAYNHGGYQPEITTTWVGMVGPGINVGGVDSSTWLDETDYRPTLLTLLGLSDDYQQDGRVIVEALNDNAIPSSLGGANRANYVQLAQSYKQINAQMGSLGMATLAASTKALKGNDAGDATYTACESAINSWVSTRNSLASQMNNLLYNAAFSGTPVNAGSASPLITQASALIAGASC